MKHIVKFVKRFLGIALTAVTMLSGVSAFAAGTTKTATPWLNTVRLEGIRAHSFNEAEQELFYLSCEGAVYVPVRTVAEWMGKECTISGSSITMSGTKEKVIRSVAASPEKKIYNTIPDFDRNASVTVTAQPGATLTLDGISKTFQMIEWNNIPYMPMRTASELLGLSIKYIPEVPDGRSAMIYIYTPPTTEQVTAFRNYFTTLSPMVETRSFNGSDTDYATQINKCLQYMQLVKNTPQPECPVLTALLKEMQEDADTGILACNRVQELIKSGADQDTLSIACAVDWTGKIDLYDDDDETVWVGAFAACRQPYGILEDMQEIINDLAS